ncbi:ribosomal protein L14b/L23e [Zalerion maritima]|uniref:Large ribosomal subunit protein uL14m n=1 Tax=Zalerion maritima TaxID=339359 RepID=A0AAD5RG48_9PEZI|nr:ribosomal protein L14b/L23e [Zalerion maritima]
MNLSCKPLHTYDVSYIIGALPEVESAKLRYTQHRPAIQLRAQHQNHSFSVCGPPSSSIANHLSGDVPNDVVAKMIILKSMLQCIDNSGAALVECVLVIGKKKAARIGDRIVVVVQKHKGAADNLMTTGAARVRRGDIRHAVIVRTKYRSQRDDGSVIRFDDNACVLVNKTGEPVGTRINGVVGKELGRKKWSKILSMAPRSL